MFFIQTYTLKTTTWNLQNHPFRKRNMIFQNLQGIMFQPLIFRTVFVWLYPGIQEAQMWNEFLLGLGTLTKTQTSGQELVIYHRENVPSFTHLLNTKHQPVLCLTKISGHFGHPTLPQQKTTSVWMKSFWNYSSCGFVRRRITDKHV